VQRAAGWGEGLSAQPVSGKFLGRNKRAALRHLRTLRRGALFRIRYGRRAIILAAQCAALIAPYGPALMWATPLFKKISVCASSF
jgi:hypothetical protein